MKSYVVIRSRLERQIISLNKKQKHEMQKKM